MEAWPLPDSEAIHTQTFLGHPAGCAAALASIETLEREGGAAQSAELGRLALTQLRDGLAGADAVREVRGLGLLIAIEFHQGERAHRLVADALQRGIILLQSGEAGQVVSISPPLNLGAEALQYALATVVEIVRASASEKTQ